MLLQNIESRFLGCPARCLFEIPTELSWMKENNNNNNNTPGSSLRNTYDDGNMTHDDDDDDDDDDDGNNGYVEECPVLITTK